MKRIKKLEALKEYRKAFYSIKMELAGVYYESLQNETKKEQIQKRIYNLWLQMNKINKILG